ncbi:Ig-like domain repeat protein [Nocardioides anomalus]|uniref:Ig-like domain repeat protein n=1 Tax=Nocardioides anomalus TaxID=2712223 RepID=A0A6G6W8G1_9ACTN|nr:Ig-like domain-containing protein [Nocardioides anomalus]QIG41395.1 Ig-like domain repeat protein [Nocardioides anomalus]
MTPTLTGRSARLGLLLAAALPVGLLTGTAGSASAVDGGDGGGGDPTQTVKIVSGPQKPLFVGDEIKISVTASASDNAVVVKEGDREIFDGGAMNPSGPTALSIPTAGVFRAGTHHLLTVFVSNGDVSGSAQFTVDPQFIPSDLDPAGFQPEYGLPLYGRLDATVPTTVVPTGTMALERGGVVKARYPIRTDGTYALYDPTMTPGVHEDVTIYYEGDANYAPQEIGTGAVVADVTVTRQHTTTTSSLSATKIRQGDPVTVLATTRSSNTESVVDPQGRMQIHASPDGVHFEQIAEVAYPGGKQTVEVPVTDWAATHPGFWTIRAVYAGDGVSFASASVRDNTLQVVEPGQPVTDTATALTLSSATTTVKSTSPVTATAKVTAAGGPVAAGEVRFSVRGQAVATVPVGADGTASTPLTVAEAGEPQVVATYLGTSEHVGSASPPEVLTVAKAATTTTAAVPAQPAAPGSVLPIQVRPTGSTVAPTGSVVVSEGATVLGSVSANGGQTQLRLPQLSPGTHQLTIAYGGDLNTEGSRSTLTYPVGSGTTPGTQVASTTALKVKKVVRGKAKVVITVSSSAPVTGTVVVLRGAKVVASGTVQDGRLVLTTKKLKRGKHQLVARFTGSATVLASTSRAVPVRVR